MRILLNPSEGASEAGKQVGRSDVPHSQIACSSQHRIHSPFAFPLGDRVLHSVCIEQGDGP
jgi:hypothetical protein